MAYLDRGSVLLLLGENLRALSDNDKALDLTPNHPLAFVNRGLAMHGLGDDAGALAAIKDALIPAPGFPPALDALQKMGAAKDAAQSQPTKATATPNDAIGRRIRRWCGRQSGVRTPHSFR